MRPSAILSKFLIVFLLSSPFSSLIAQESRVFNAEIFDVGDSSPLPGANVYWEDDLSTGVISDEEGRFQIKIKTLPARLVVSFIGFETSIRMINEKDLEKSQ